MRNVPTAWDCWVFGREGAVNFYFFIGYQEIY